MKTIKIISKFQIGKTQSLKEPKLLKNLEKIWKLFLRIKTNLIFLKK